MRMTGLWPPPPRPILANLCFIVGAISIPIVAADLGMFKALPIAIGLLIAGFCQLLFLFFVLRRLSAVPKLQWPRLSNAGKHMWRKFLPAALGAGGMQLNLLVDLILASMLPVGTISWLYYADRVAQLPLGIVGIALGTALLPRLSAAEATGQKDEITKTLDEAIIFGGFFVVPAVIALILLAGPIIEGLFVYGAFSIDDAVMAAMALSAYALGLPGFVMVKILQPAFYAAGQPGTVLKISIMTVVINITASLVMMPIFGHVGLALATSLSGLIAAITMDDFIAPPRPSWRWFAWHDWPDFSCQLGHGDVAFGDGLACRRDKTVSARGRLACLFGCCWRRRVSLSRMVFSGNSSRICQPIGQPKDLTAAAQAGITLACNFNCRCDGFAPALLASDQA
jgi:murein biosynthesis integral membrane protein MurJ